MDRAGDRTGRSRPPIEAREKGYQYGVLFSTEMGVPVYERIGFRLTGGHINRYLWQTY